jgi:cob(I)alamin adenosyltransferase
MKIYTKTGDTGETGLFGGPRVSKDAPRIEAYGTLDELNAVLGVVRASGLPAAFDAAVARVQHQLFDLGAELASPDPEKLRVSGIGEQEIAALEQEIDAWEATLPPLRQFILPGGSLAGAQVHVARTVCRRAERRLVTLAAVEREHIDPLAVKYVNRLSDWLFVLARAVNLSTGNGDTPWQPRSK